ncbi:MAG: sigma-54-dependent Fis family transcriptional regulator [Sphingobacteriia bacterium]|nr:sigma-54-dependent Fis family transcriptional regulator [Sphingobacteriia bacterium]
MRLLIIGDLSGELYKASQVASKRGASVRQANNIDNALEDLRSGNSADLIFIDAKQNIKKLVDQLSQEKIFANVIACGFDQNKDDAVTAIKSGAKEYLPLPPDEDLIVSIIEAISIDNKDFIASSETMQKIMQLGKQVASSDATILITGESGTGKEVMAKFLHTQSKRKTKPFVSVNCAAIPENLLESELFGHEKGAFTGAVARRVGKFEEANGGTLLLDEISEIDIKLQAKLLRAIQEKEIERIGGNNKVKLDIRIIATSNRTLSEEVKNGRFREDLYFRLNVINISLPPLRERREDILKISSFYIEKYSKQNSLKIPKFDEEALKIVENYNWPGNVRELENTMYRACLLAENGIISKDSLMISAENSFRAKSLADLEKEAISSTLKNCLGDHIAAAKILGISVKNLEEKLAAYEQNM